MTHASRSRVPMLVLAHLGLAGGFLACVGEAPPARDPGHDRPQPEASATASATTSTSTSATATATATATTSEPQGTVCKEDRDCPPYAFCDRAPTPDAAAGHCLPRPNYRLGRPLVVDGAAHVAPYAAVGIAVERADEEIEALLRGARDEHASIAAFARTIAELMALGAPTWLLAKTQRALADEIRHTDLTLDRLERRTGARPSLAALDAATLPLRRGDDAARALLRDVFRGGAIGETLAAAEAERRHALADDPAARDFYETILNDESRHAALAFETLGWLVAARPELAPVLAEERARFVGDASADERALLAPILATLS